jgi:surface polysaccharide O-acyltransferase-like enzyme
MAATERTDFIDRLRVMLTVLVILHHAAITYGGSGGWFYREVRDPATASSLLLTMFCAVNQAFFMGMFFLLAGYFTPASLARKGSRAFVRDRVVRLGLPLLFFGFVLGPLTVALAGVPAGRGVADAWLGLLAGGAFVIGPLWFAWALLIFSLAFVGWRLVRPEPAPDPERALPSSMVWLPAAIAVGAAALALRQVVPVGQDMFGLQLGYFASYVFLFGLGAMAWRYRWLERVDRRQAVQWGWVTLATMPMLFVTAALTGALDGRPVNFNGGLGMPAVVYAFWEPLVAWGLIAGLLVVFRNRFNRPSAHWQAWSGQAYGAFIVHAPIMVALAVASANWPLPPLVKLAVIGSAGVVASFIVAAMLLKVPGARRVL